MSQPAATTTTTMVVEDTQITDRQEAYKFPSARAYTKEPKHWWHNAVAGAVAGAGSRIATAPLDLIRIRRQLSPRTLYPSESIWQSWRTIVRTEGGITALFRGNLAANYLWIGYAATQFSLYGKTRLELDRRFMMNETLTAFCAGAVAGTCATLATYPFDVCRTTFAAQGVVQDEATITATKTSTSHGQKPAIVASQQPRGQQMPFHSLGDPQYSKRPHSNTSGPAVSSTSSATSSSASCKSSIRPPKTLWEFAVAMYRQKGMFGFYAGAQPAVLQIIPYMGLNFAIYDALTRNDKSVTLSASAGSMSGAVSKIIVYPIDTIKRRLQAQAFFVESASAVYYTGLMDCAQRILYNEGVASFYRGIVPSVLKSTIATGLTFAIFRFSKNSLEYFA